MHISDPAQQQEDIDAIRQALKDSKGPGNFRNLFLYSPNGKKDGVQLIPVSEVAAKDEFFIIKNVSRDDVLAAHRILRSCWALCRATLEASARYCLQQRYLRETRLRRFSSDLAPSTSGLETGSLISIPMRSNWAMATSIVHRDADLIGSAAIATNVAHVP